MGEPSGSPHQYFSFGIEKQVLGRLTGFNLLLERGLRHEFGRD